MSELLFILAGILVFLSLTLYILDDFDLLSPPVIATGIMAISSTLAFLASDVFNFQMTFKGMFLLLLGILSFVAASYFVKYKIQMLSIKKLADFSIKPKLLLAFSGIMFVFLMFNFWEVYSLAEKFGHNSVFGMISAVRPHIEQEDAAFSRWTYYRLYFAQGLAYVSTFALFYKLFYEKKLERPLLIPMALYAPFLLLSTGRMGLLVYAIYIAVVAGILYRLSRNDTIEARKYSSKLVIGAGVAFFFLFLIFGFFTGKVSLSEGARGPFLILAHYGGASIPAFGEIMKLPLITDGSIGSHTLVGAYRVLGKFMELPDIMLFLPFVEFSGLNTNVYTAFYRYILDFGALGMVMIMMIFGVGYTFFYMLASRGALGIFGIIAYGAFSFPIFLFFQDERFFLDIFGTTAIYQIVSLYFFYKIMCICKK